MYEKPWLFYLRDPPEMIEKQPDRRMFERIPVALPVKFSNLTSHKEGLSQARDVSANGLGLVTDEQLSPRDSLELWLQMPSPVDSPSATGKMVWGKVVWSKKVAPDTYRTGIRLDKPEFIWMSLIINSLRPSMV